MQQASAAPLRDQSYKTDASRTVSGVLMPCPHTLLRAFDTMRRLDCFPTEIAVHRRPASLRFEVRIPDCDLPSERLADELRRIVGVRAVAVAAVGRSCVATPR
ncbi:hypothetical protein [Sphingomonas sp. CLY1604]|uniref:hypothetical protein n=1 Tax=Sphingomonas sp. CLY1604 TaxID=3457786 RepID=UPI003FD7B4DE